MDSGRVIGGPERPPIMRKPRPGERGLQGNDNRRTDHTPAHEAEQRAKVVPFPSAWRCCAGCAIRFRPRASWHRLCPRCHAGAAAIVALRRVARLLEVVR